MRYLSSKQKYRIAISMLENLSRRYLILVVDSLRQVSKEDPEAPPIVHCLQFSDTSLSRLIVQSPLLKDYNAARVLSIDRSLEEASRLQIVGSAPRFVTFFFFGEVSCGTSNGSVGKASFAILAVRPWTCSETFFCNNALKIAASSL